MRMLNADILFRKGKSNSDLYMIWPDNDFVK